MPQSLAKVVVHIVFSTKYRYPFFADEGIRKEMHAYLGGTFNELGCQVLTVGGTADHVHILCVLSRTHPIADVVGELKKNSSKWVKTKGAMLEKFAWQNGYGIFSVSEREVPRVRKYIARQQEHHQRKSFEGEYRECLRRHNLSYDERFVWD
jgi:putative transposase